jgi:hypothetical protein
MRPLRRFRTRGRKKTVSNRALGVFHEYNQRNITPTDLDRFDTIALEALAPASLVLIAVIVSWMDPGRVATALVFCLAGAAALPLFVRLIALFRRRKRDSRVVEGEGAGKGEDLGDGPGHR